jgi:hypothetical protein
MAKKDLRQVNCPDDKTILAFRSNELSGEEYDAVALHLLFCNDCRESLNSLPWEEVEGDEGAPEVDEPRPNVHITPSLSRAIKLFRERHQQNASGTPGTPKEIQEDRIRVGQIWRTKSEGIAVPSSGGTEYHSVTELNSRPHLVIITRTKIDNPSSGTDYHTILVAPVDGNTEYKDQGDLFVAQEDSPLGYSFITQLWNEQPMLQENLDCCLGDLNPEQHSTLLSTLDALGDKESSGTSYSLEAIIMKGLYQDPMMRYRAKEYEDTAYLRMPVQSLIEIEDSRRHVDVIIFPELIQPIVRLAAGTEVEEETLETSDQAPVIQARVMIDGQPFEFVEDPVEGSIILLGNIPPDATHIFIGLSLYELKHSEDNSSAEVIGVGLAEMEAPLKRHFSEPGKHPIRFLSK